MQVIGSCPEDGYAQIADLVPREVARAFVHRLKEDIGPDAIPLSRVADFPNLLTRPSFEVCGHHYTPMLFFLWG